MFEILTCPRGHHWQPQPADREQGSEGVMTCPVCAREDESAGELGGSTQLPDTNLALPPLPRPVPPMVANVAAGLHPNQTPGIHARAPADGITHLFYGSAFAGYEILGRIGRGGMGVVYKARQINLNRLVALKMILTGAHANDAELLRFRTEAEAVAQLRHPGIVQIYEIGEYQGTAYISFEYVDGGSLAERLNGHAQPPRMSARFVETLARAVHYAHQHGIIHRDLKPGNILLEGSKDWEREANSQQTGDRPGSKQPTPGLDPCLMTPKIADFGLAKRVNNESGLSRTTVVMGTPTYMAPEQAQGRVSPLTDIHALGTILYEILTGRPPFLGLSVEDTLRKVETEEAVPPWRYQSGVPRDLETICLKCLEKEPLKRYGTAEALADDLKRFLADEPILARRTRAWERGWKWARRRPAAAALLAVCATAIITLLAVWGRFTVRLGDERNFALRQEKIAKHVSLIAREQGERAERERDLVRDENRAARRNLYVAHMNLAHSAWHEPDVLRMMELLEAHRPKRPDEEDLRGFEWYYLHRLGHSHGMTLRGHTGWVSSIAFGPGGLLLSGSLDGSVKVWEPATGRELRTLAAHRGGVDGVAWHPDGKLFGSCGRDRNVRIWSLATGKLERTLSGHQDRVSSIAFSPTGQQVASGGSDQTVRLWNLNSGLLERTLKHGARVNSVAFGPDGKHIVGAGDAYVIKIWDTESGREVRNLRQRSWPAHSIVYSPNGKLLATASLGSLNIWNAVSGQEFRSYPFAGRMYGLAFSPTGDRLAVVGWDGTVKILQPTSGHETLTLRGHTDGVFCVDFSPDGSCLASAGKDRTIRLWDPARIQGYRVLHFPRSKVLGLSFNPDGKQLAFGVNEGKAWILDSRTGKEIHVLTGHEGPLYSVAFDSEGRHLASAGQDKQVIIWDTATGNRLRTIQSDAPVYAVAFSTDGRHIFAGGRGDRIHVWEALTCKLLYSIAGHTGRISCLVINKDGSRLATGSTDHTVKIWDTQTRKLLTTLVGHSGNIFTVRFSPDGRLLASAGDDKTIKLWDTTTGQLVRSLRAHAQQIRSLDFSPDSHRLASGSFDGTAKLWSVEMGQELLTVYAHRADVRALAFSPDGQRLVTGGEDRRLKIWDATPLPAHSGTGPETDSRPPSIDASGSQMWSDVQQFTRGIEHAFEPVRRWLQSLKQSATKER